MGVRIRPGHTALTRMPDWAYSSAAVFVSPTIPCLLAAYAEVPCKPTSPSTEELLTIEPAPWLSIWTISCFIHSHTLKVDCDNPVPVFIRVIGCVGCHAAFDTRVVEGVVQPPVCLHRPSYERFDLRSLGHVGLDEGGFTSVFFDEAHRLLTAFDRDVRDNHRGAFFGEQLGARSSYTRGAARHQRHLAAKPLLRHSHAPAFSKRAFSSRKSKGYPFFKPPASGAVVGRDARG